MIFKLMELLYCIIDFILLDGVMACLFKRRVIKLKPYLLVGCSLLTYELTQFEGLQQIIMALLLMVAYVMISYRGHVIGELVFTILFDIIIGLVTLISLNLMSYFLHSSIEELICLRTYERLVVVSSIKLILALVTLGIRKMIKPLKIEVPRPFYYKMSVFFSVSFISTLALFKISLDFDLFNREIMIISSVLGGFNLITYFMFIKVIEAIKNETKLEWSLKNQELLEGNMTSLAASYDEIKKIKHDEMNHYRVIEGLLEIDEVSECKEYVSQLKQKLQKVPIYYQTGHVVADSVINQKVYCSQSFKIQFEIKVWIPDSIKMETTDLGSLLFNLMDNAIEAVKKVAVEDRKIILTIHPYGEDLCLNIQNTVKFNPIINNELVKSFKKDLNEHGYGMLNIKYIVTRYQGQMTYCCKENLFEVNILLKHII